MNAGLKAEQAKNGGGAPSGSAAAASLAPAPGVPTDATTSAPEPSATAPSGGSAVAAAATVARPTGHGLTFTLAPVGGKAVADASLTHLSCHGEPRQADQPHRDSCNAYKGDTSCRVVLPVLRFQGKGLPPPRDILAGHCSGWSGRVLGATQPVMGAVLASEAMATARCEKELGTDWRMAEFHDAGGWGMQGQRGVGLAPNTRFWVHFTDQPGNC